MSKPLIIQKFGGKSLATPEHIRQAAKTIQRTKDLGYDVVAVVSAMGKTTDELVSLAHSTVKLPSRRELDMLLTAGERISMSLMAMALDELGIAAISFTGSQSGIITDDVHNEARIVDVRPVRVKEELNKGKVVIIAGFQGVSLNKEVTTLGRGGSDTTAVALAAVLKAERCEILTDVEGLYDADPKLVSNAKIIESCDYDEALELSGLGAKLHARSIELAKEHQVTVRVASSHSQEQGTWITNKKEEKDLETRQVKALVTKRGFYFVHTSASLEKVLEACQKTHVPLRFFQASKKGVSFLSPQDRFLQLKSEFTEEEWEEEKDIATLSLVGNGMATCSELLPALFYELEQEKCRCFLATLNSASLTAAIHHNHLEKITQRLYSRWF